MNKNIQSLPLRNIGIVAHVDAGKTTTSERILYYSDVIHRIGEVDSGSATMDWMDQERDRGITITSAATHLQWDGVGVNLIDTPGHVDFTAEVERSLRVLDGAVVIFDAVNGVEPQSETVWKQANRYGVPRLVHINKLDRVGADFKAAYIDITRKLKVHGDVELLALVVPGRETEGGELTGVIDVLTEEYIVWEAGGDGSKWTTGEIPGVMRGEVDEWRDRVFTVLGDHNEKIANDYLNTGAVDCELCYAEIRRLTIAREIFPVFCGASLRNIGVQPLLDGVVRYLPAPEELPAVRVFDRDGESAGEVERSNGKRLLALVFKIAHDRERGDLAFVRVYSGTLRSGDMTYNVGKSRSERVSALLRMHADSSSSVREIGAGDIGVVVGLKHAQTGDTLSGDKSSNALLEEIRFPQPVISASLETHSLSERDKLLRVLEYFAKEDPTFTWNDDEETGELVISGMGELHLDVAATRITQDFGLAVRAGKPHVRYRETISGENSVREEFVQMIGNTRHEMVLSCAVRGAAGEADDGDDYGDNTINVRARESESGGAR